MASVAPVTVRLVVATPEYGAPSRTLLHVEPPAGRRCHFTVGVGVPDTATVNVAFPPNVTVAAEGWLVMAGAIAAAFTVSVAVALVASGVTPFAASTRN